MFTKSRIHQMVTIVVALTMLFSTVQPSPASAQGGDRIRRQVNAQSGKVSFIGPESGRVLLSSDALGIAARPQDPALALVNRYAPEFGVKNPANDLSEMKSLRSEDGRVTVRYQQEYNDIPVMGGELVVNTNDNGDLYSMNGEVSQDLSLQTQPTIDSAQAAETALQAMAKWYGKSPADFVATEPELWIFDESLLRPSTRPVELVWRMEVTPVDAGMPVRELVLVNAQKGGISLHFNQVDTAWGGARSSNGSREALNLSVSPTVENVPALAGVIWYVSTTGDDTNTCSSPDAPCLTMDGAIAKAGSGDVIKVANGTYTNTTGNVVTISKGLTLSGGWDETFSTQSGASVIDGGGVRNGVLVTAVGSTVVLEYFVVQNSYTGSDSGGIYLFGANLTLRNSSVINNHAGRGAGIFMINNASLTVLNSTVSNNTANTSGGGIYAVNGTVTLNNSTIAYNNSNSVGGGFTNGGASFTVRNSILANNTASSSAPDCSGSVTSSDHNIIGDTTGCTVTSGTGDQFNINPLIDSDLIGTLPIHALQTESPAINAGDNNTCLTTDQRGMPRPQGSACDIGAYENSLGGLVVVSGSNQSANLGYSFPLPLVVYVFDGLMNPVPGVTVTFSAPDSGASGVFNDSGVNITTATTNGSGKAVSSIITANNQTGNYSITANATGIPGVAVFQLANSSELYVANTGSDANSCRTVLLPCATINGAIDKVSSGEKIKVATGIYTGTGTYVVLIGKDITLSGGWDPGFAVQAGMSIIDGQSARGGFSANNSISSIDHFIIKNTITSGLVLNSSTTNLTADSVSIYDGLTGITNNGVLTLDNVTVSRNKQGGVRNNGSLIVRNSTIAYNNSIASGGGLNALSIGTTLVQNTIIANNTAASGGQDCSGTLSASSTHNIIKNPAGCTIPSGNLTSVEPNLISYIVPFTGTHALLQGSIAIDAGDPATCVTEDQRGIDRPQGVACDIGAFEYMTPGQAYFIDVFAGGNQHALPGQTYAVPFSVFVVDAKGNPVSGASVNFTAPSSGASGVFSSTGNAQTTVGTTSIGVATASSFTANQNFGAYSVLASVSGVVNPAVFSVMNTLWFVAPNGNDSNSCLVFTEPCATITGAISKAFAGDTIKVAEGTYPSVTISKNISLSGGWNSSFTLQSGLSTIDGQASSRCLRVAGTSASPVNVNVGNFIFRNGKASGGAGIYVDQYATLTLNNSTVEHNYSTSSSGGGVYVYFRGALNINNSTIAANQADGSGGGIFTDGNTVINNSTIAGNEALIAGGGIRSTRNTTMRNSILSNNLAASFLDCSGGIQVNDHNIIESTAGCTITPGAGDQFNVDPSLAVYLPEKGYYPLLPSSSAINAADSLSCLPTDQRGVTRVGICDIGAFEYRGNGISPAGIVAYDGTPQNIIAGSPAQENLKAFVFDEYGDSVMGATVTFTAPISGPSVVFADTSNNISTAVTNEDGVAISPALTANNLGGHYAIESTITGAGDPAIYSIYNQHPSYPDSLSIISGADQSAPRQSQFTYPLKLLVKNYLGHPVPGITVTFTAPPSGASVIFSSTNTNVNTVVTGVDGIAASSTFEANIFLGSYVVQATVSGVLSPTDIYLSNVDRQIKTYTAGNTSSLPGSLLCIGEDYPACANEDDSHSVSAHGYAIGVIDFYADKHIRNGIDGSTMPVISTVHFCPTINGVVTCPYANAFWNGEQMVYGDAYGYPLADDIVAHEFTHGVTQYESNLFYYYQSGAINESFSDLWGEYYDQINGQGNDAAGVKWRIGEDIDGLINAAPLPQQGLRDMKDPTLFNDPDRMSSPNYYEGTADNGGVHWNSGVNNKAVYLMVNGGTFNGKTVTALGWEKTGAIYYEAQTNLLVSGSDYSDLYYALQRACTNLIGKHGITAVNCAEVKDAVDAVEMNSQPSTNFNADAPMCSAGTSPLAILSDDFENGLSKWILTIHNDPRWQIDSQYYGSLAHSGLHSLHAEDYPAVATDAIAEFASVTIPSNAYLWFAHAYEFESGYFPGDPTLYYFDGGVLEYSKNGGSTWIDAGSLIDHNGYKGSLHSGYNNPLANHSAFVGTSHGYISTRLNLSSLAGQTVLFRWRMGLDNGTYAGGWWVDDVKVYTCVDVVSHARDFSTPFVPPSGSAIGMLQVRNKPAQQGQSAVVSTPTPMPELLLPTSTPQPVFAEVVIPTFTPEPVMAMNVVDTLAPETTLLVTPGVTSRQRSAFFAYESTEAGKFLCSLDGSAYFACEHSIRFTGLGVGMHLFQVRALDEAGNFDDIPANYTWVIEENSIIQRYKKAQ